MLGLLRVFKNLILMKTYQFLRPSPPSAVPAHSKYGCAPHELIHKYFWIGDKIPPPPLMVIFSQLDGELYNTLFTGAALYALSKVLLISNKL